MAGYRRVKIRTSQQVIDMALPVAIAMVNGGTAEYVEEEKPLEEAKASAASAKVETSAVLAKNAETAMKPGKPQSRQVSR
jgi:hypothetical protein